MNTSRARTRDPVLGLQINAATFNGFNLNVALMVSRVAQQFPCEVHICRGGRMLNAKEVLSVLAVGSVRGMNLQISACGSDAAEAVRMVSREVVEHGNWEEDNR